MLQLQPLPAALLIESKPEAPPGKVSVTVTRLPLVGTEPMLEATRVKVVFGAGREGGQVATWRRSGRGR